MWMQWSIRRHNVAIILRVMHRRFHSLAGRRIPPILEIVSPVDDEIRSALEMNNTGRTIARQAGLGIDWATSGGDRSGGDLRHKHC